MNLTNSPLPITLVTLFVSLLGCGATSGDSAAAAPADAPIFAAPIHENHPFIEMETLHPPPFAGAEGSCVAGVWTSEPLPCLCARAPFPPCETEARSLAPELAFADCRELSLLVLGNSGEAMAATLYVSSQSASLSAKNGVVDQGEWEYLDDSELVLSFEENDQYTPTECEDGELSRKGEPSLKHPKNALAKAIQWALTNDDWSGVPFNDNVKAP